MLKGNNDDLQELRIEKNNMEKEGWEMRGLLTHLNLNIDFTCKLARISISKQ